VFKLKEGTVIEIKDRNFEDSFGRYPTDFNFGSGVNVYNIDLIILDSALRNGTCWFFIRADRIADGFRPEFYARFNDIKDSILLPQCDVDEDCIAGYYCNMDNYQCIEKECEEDEDCGEEYFCDTSRWECIEKDCMNDEDCDSGYYCDIEYNECVEKGCEKDEDCSTNYYCDKKIWECLEKFCEKNEDCSDGYYCDIQNKECLPKECTKNEDCSDGYYCDNNLGECVEKGCKEHSDCDEGYYCNIGTWECEALPECVSDADCVPAECCHADACIHKTVAPNCTGISCTEECMPGTLDCGQGSCLCQEGKCVAKIAKSSLKDFTQLVGFYPVSKEMITDAASLNSLSIGYYDKDNTKNLNIDSKGLSLFIKTDDTKYTDRDWVLFENINFSEIIYKNSNVKGYWIIDDPCNEKILVEDLEKLYTLFMEEDEKIPVMINFKNLDCALDYFREADNDLVDVVLFEVQDVNNDAAKALSIFDELGYKIKIIPIIAQKNIGPEVLRNLGLSILQKSEFFGIIIDSSYLASATTNLNYKNAVREIFCMANEKYFNVVCRFRPEEEKEVKVAFIGNTGTGINAVNVIKLINEEKADVVVHLGNLGYDAEPSVFAKMIEDNLDENIQFTAVIGKKEFDANSWANYEAALKGFSSNMDCQGLYGNKMHCSYEDLSFVLSGVGIELNTDGHLVFIEDSLKIDKRWKICAWHKSNYYIRVSDKPANDNLVLNYYDMCKDAGAIIVTGYDMAYARTKLLTSLSPIAYNINDIYLDKGTVAFVSGLGGYGSDKFNCNLHEQDKGLWQTVLTPNYYIKNGQTSGDSSCTSTSTNINDFAPGVLFITFNYNKNPNQAMVQFKTINNNIIDSFIIYKES
jgi:hypothetical protein